MHLIRRAPNASCYREIKMRKVHGQLLSQNAAAAVLAYAHACNFVFEQNRVHNIFD